MNIILLNLDLSTPDYYLDAATLLDKTPAVIIPYVESQGWAFGLEEGLTCGSTIQCKLDQLSALVSVAPGPRTLKFLHDFVKNEQTLSKRNVHVIIYLAEHWLINQHRYQNDFKFEAYCAYLSSCLSIGYSGMSLACASSASADYYAETILGGFCPKVVSISQSSREVGIVRHPPTGLG